MYQAAIDHEESANVRSPVGLMVGASWVMNVVHAIGDCWDGAPDRCTYPAELSPSAKPRPHHPKSAVAVARSGNCAPPRELLVADIF